MCVCAGSCDEACETNAEVEAGMENEMERRSGEGAEGEYECEDGGDDGDWDECKKGFARDRVGLHSVLGDFLLLHSMGTHRREWPESDERVSSEAPR